jgi:hypothetical protein
MATYEELRAQVNAAHAAGDTDLAKQLAAQAKAIGPSSGAPTDLEKTPEDPDRNLNPAKDAKKVEDADLNPASYEELRAQVNAAHAAGNTDLARKLAFQAKAVKEAEKTNTFADIGKGVGAGAVNIVQGISELGAMGLDAALDTDYLSGVTEGIEEFKRDSGLVPTGTAGKVAEGLVTYGSAAIPIAGWLGRASSVAKGAKVLPGTSRWARTSEAFGRSKAGKALLNNRAKLAGSTAIATGAADFLVAPSTDETISDQFDALPDFLRTEDLEGMTGRERNAAAARNKLRLAFEGMTIGLGVDAAMPAVAATARGVSQVPGVPTAARALSRGMDLVGEQLGKSTFLRQNFTSAGLLEPKVYEDVLSTEGLTDQFAVEAGRAFKNWHNATIPAVRAQKLLTRNRKGVRAAHSDLYDFMIGSLDPKEYSRRYGVPALKAAENMRTQVDGMTDILARQIDQADVDPKVKGQLITELEKNKGKYLRRLYDVHLNPAKYEGKNLTKDPKYKAALEQVTKNLQQADSSLTSDVAAQRAEEIIADTINGQASNLGITTGEAVNKIGQAMSRQARTDAGGRAPLYRISEGMLKKRNPYLTASPALRDLMGEVKDPKALYFKTVEDMANVIAGNKFYNTINPLGLREALPQLQAGGRPMAISGDSVSPEVALELNKAGYVQLGARGKDAAFGEDTGQLVGSVFGGDYGRLSGAFVPAELQKAITAPVRNRSVLQEALALSLQAKGLSQMSKTVLNPLSQIRNALSNNFVLLANGNWGRNMDTSESYRLLAANVADMSDAAFEKELRMLQVTGTVGQNLTTNETKALLQEGAEQPIASQVSKLGQTFAEKTKVIPFAQRLYAAGDDFFKIIGTRAEKAKYVAALRRGGLTEDRLREIAPELQAAGLLPRTTELTGEVDLIDLLSTDIVKSTMPTYSRVPEAIKNIRRIPIFGNFVAFPAEIMRTSTNILDRGLKEMSFKPSPALVQKLGQKEANRLAREIRAIGSQRVSGLASAAVVLPAATVKAAHRELEISDTEEQALDRMSAFWEKGSQLMYVSKPNNGYAEYLNLSYMMPYDFLLTPARAAMNAYARKGEVNAEDISVVKEMVKASLGKFLEPFASESLAAERVADVTYRGGRTSQGAIIYRDVEDDGDKIKKSIVHVMGGFIPGLAEQAFKVSGGKVKPGRVTRAITGVPSAQGQEFSVAEEAATMMVGFRRMELNLRDNFKYKGSEYSSLRRQADGVFGNAAAANDTTAEDVIEAYKETLRLRRKVQAELYADIQAAKALDLSEQKIIQQLMQDANLGRNEVGLIMQGKFAPLKISDNAVEKVLREVGVQNQARVLQRLPVRELVEIYRDQVNTPLIIEPVEEAETPAQATPAAPAASAPAQAAPVPAAPAAIPPNVANPATRQAPPQELLGANLIDRLRNAEIFNRGQ